MQSWFHYVPAQGLLKPIFVHDLSSLTLKVLTRVLCETEYPEHSGAMFVMRMIRPPCPCMLVIEEVPQGQGHYWGK